jgi:hypothetical protein
MGRERGGGGGGGKGGWWERGVGKTRRVEKVSHSISKIDSNSLIKFILFLKLNPKGKTYYFSA